MNNHLLVLCCGDSNASLDVHYTCTWFLFTLLSLGSSSVGQLCSIELEHFFLEKFE